MLHFLGPDVTIIPKLNSNDPQRDFGLTLPAVTGFLVYCVLSLQKDYGRLKKWGEVSHFLVFT